MQIEIRKIRIVAPTREITEEILSWSTDRGQSRISIFTLGIPAMIDNTFYVRVCDQVFRELVGDLNDIVTKPTA